MFSPDSCVHMRLSLSNASTFPVRPLSLSLWRARLSLSNDGASMGQRMETRESSINRNRQTVDCANFLNALIFVQPKPAYRRVYSFRNFFSSIQFAVFSRFLIHFSLTIISTVPSVLKSLHIHFFLVAIFRYSFDRNQFNLHRNICDL